MSSNLIFAIIVWYCALIFTAIALWAFKKREPMHFWSGSTIKSEQITDIPAYNRANGIMWSAYAVALAACGVAALVDARVGTALTIAVGGAGTAALVLVYQRIFSKYRAH